MCRWWLTFMLPLWIVGMFNAGQSEILPGVDTGVAIFVLGTSSLAACLLMVPMLVLVLRENDPPSHRTAIIVARVCGAIACAVLAIKCAEFALTAAQGFKVLSGPFGDVLRVCFVVCTSVSCWCIVRALPHARDNLTRLLGHAPLPPVHSTGKSLVAISFVGTISVINAVLAANAGSLLGPVLILWLATATILGMLSPLNGTPPIQSSPNPPVPL